MINMEVTDRKIWLPDAREIFRLQVPVIGRMLEFPGSMGSSIDMKAFFYLLALHQE